MKMARGEYEIQVFDIYDGDATVRVVRDAAKDKKIADMVIDWMQENNAISGESIFQSDRCHETACIMLGDLADDVINPTVEWKDE